MNKLQAVTQCLVLTLLSFSVQPSQADSMKKSKGGKNPNIKILNVDNKCEKISNRDPYATYYLDLKSRKCVPKSFTSKPHCPEEYELFQKKCLKQKKK